MNTIIWKGVQSTTIEGLLICELPPITKPPMRVKETTIDGRDGSIIEELGYSSYDKSITIGLRGNFDINKVIKYFTGEGEIVFSNEPDKVYTAKVIGQIDYNRLLRFRTAVVTFKVQPFKYKYNEAYKETPTEAITGTSLVVTPKEDDILKSFSIYGKTTQDGTPTPDSPVDLVSVGDSGSITVNVDEQSMTIATPNGLHGIPVSSGGNYTDANGQQWICDEIDLARGVYVQRCGEIEVDGTSITVGQHGNSQCYCTQFAPNIVMLSGDDPKMVLSNKYEGSGWTNHNNKAYCIGNSIVLTDKRFTDKDTTVAILQKEKPKVVYVLADTIEMPLSAEELSAFAEMHISEPNATMSNDANANMNLEYFKPFEVFNEGLENSKPKMVLRGSGTVGISVNGIHIFDYTFPEGETEVVIDSEKEDAYLGDVLKNRNMNGEFPILQVGTNKIEWSGYVESIEILPRSRWL